MWIKDTVEGITKKYKTNDPFEIIAAKDIILVERDMDEEIYGFYKYIRRNKFIFLNSKLNEPIKKFTCAHELAHVELHPDTNTPFLRSNTLLSVDKIEQEANRFAVELLLSDESICQYEDTNLTIKEIGGIYGVPDEVIHLKKF
ncbi:ImmA/IrrE family metallo-endopeptidase [Oceanobacillus jeddahense]|uniref:ImmA/IrrE family metallo-endopeptidase n=1 Tax=Oceanobacillus jeddahense TaxID=1462527 RepID=UPI0005960889|nr:ImmA/IrrE family metallo-endopeptidase [Oceanobacillus jeddahense]